MFTSLSQSRGGKRQRQRLRAGFSPQAPRTRARPSRPESSRTCHWGGSSEVLLPRWPRQERSEQPPRVLALASHNGLVAAAWRFVLEATIAQHPEKKHDGTDDADAPRMASFKVIGWVLHALLRTRPLAGQKGCLAMLRTEPSRLQGGLKPFRPLHILGSASLPMAYATSPGK